MSERDFPSWVNKYIGIPFEEGGETPEEGFNCWTLARWIQQEEFGVVLPTYREHYKNSHDYQGVGKIIHASIHHWTEVEQEWEPTTHIDVGCILFFRRQGDLLHCATSVSNHWMIHVLEHDYTALTKFTAHKYWGPGFIQAYRHR